MVLKNIKSIFTKFEEQIYNSKILPGVIDTIFFLRNKTNPSTRSSKRPLLVLWAMQVLWLYFSVYEILHSRPKLYSYVYQKL